MTGFAVIDLETTGFAYNARDRVCEVAVVLVDPLGREEHAYSTLVNPKRDLGAQHVHRIDARDARVAPTFEQIVGDLTELLAGRTVVAHNAVFDVGFLAAEYDRAGWPVDSRTRSAAGSSSAVLLIAAGMAGGMVSVSRLPCCSTQRRRSISRARRWRPSSVAAAMGSLPSEAASSPARIR